MITCDEVIETIKIVPTKTVPAKSALINFYILLAFLLIITALLIAVSIHCSLIKYRAKKNIYCHIMARIKNQKKFVILII